MTAWIYHEHLQTHLVRKMHKIIDTLPGKKNALYDPFNYSGCSWDVCAG